MFRSRDFVAIIMAFILARMAWNDSNESLGATSNLAFYFPREKARVASPMDLDGDGTSEALAVIRHVTKSRVSSWILQVMDLKPLHPKTASQSSAAVPPFSPEVLFESEMTQHRNAMPLELVSGQVLVKQSIPDNHRQKHKVSSDTEITDQSRHYFCGTSWHDASQRCGTPCPKGQADECPDDETCYADTPCDVHQHKAREDTETLFQLTPGGGLPSLVTLWSDGVLSLHSLTAETPLAESLTLEGRQKKDKTKEPLELREMWHVQLLPNTTHPDSILWMESNVLFLDAYESYEVAAKHGMVVVSGIYKDEGLGEDAMEYSFLIAVDAISGKVIWDSFSDDIQKETVAPLPVGRGSTSFARRRSRIAALEEHGPMTMKENLPNCLVTFKQHVQEFMPYSYWVPKDATLTAAHLNLKKKHQHDKHGHKSVQKSSSVADSVGATTKGHKKKMHQHYFHKPKHSATFGRPNVITTKTKGGLQIRSLRNGRPLCHLSLLEESLYSDLNNDGILDQVQVLLHSRKTDPKDQWVWSLVNRLQKADIKGDKSNSKSAKEELATSDQNLCHAMALSGMPAKEELFAVSLCGQAHHSLGEHPAMALDTVSPLVVESLSGRRNTRDVVVALNNGMVHRLHGHSGRRQWHTVGKHHESFPTWEQSGSGNALLTRLQSRLIPPSIRPILLVGENSLAVVSAKTGEVLALSPFPQTSIQRPVLAEVSGDGTTDLVVFSEDAVWGFHIRVQPGRPVTLRIMVGLLLMLLMLAVIRNRMSRKDVRATDP